MITLLTLGINGTSMPKVYRALKVYPKRVKDEHVLDGNIHHIEHHGQDMYETLRQNWIFGDLDKTFLETILPPLSKFMPAIREDNNAACNAALKTYYDIDEAMKD